MGKGSVGERGVSGMLIEGACFRSEGGEDSCVSRMCVRIGVVGWLSFRREAGCRA